MQSVNGIKVAVETLIQAAFGVGYTAALPAGFHAWAAQRSLSMEQGVLGIAALLPKLRGRDGAT